MHPAGSAASARRVIASAGAVVLDAAGRILLVRRLTEPGAGLWSIPGGKSLPGEPRSATAERETAEETGLIVKAERLLGRQQLPQDDQVVYDNEDWLVTVVDGDLAAGDDAGDAAWFAPGDLRVDELTEDLVVWLQRYGVLDAGRE